MNAAIYARYSSDNQREESIDAQIRGITEFAERNSILITNTYIDEAKSATTDNRPSFLQMMNDAESGHFDAVIVHKLDRFSRDRYDSAYHKRRLKNANVRLISMTENLDDSPESVILESVLEGMAEYYSKNLSREVKKGMKETALQCKHTGGIPPLGYDVTPDKTYVINEYEAAAIRKIFNEYVEGKSYKNIARELNESGHRTKIGRKFQPTSLHTILRNEKYAGVYVFNKTQRTKTITGSTNKLNKEEDIIRIQGGMPTIIDQLTFDNVQKKLHANKKRSQTYKAKEIYLLSGKLECGLCNRLMSGTRRHAGRNKSLLVTYQCNTRKNHNTCNKKEVNRDRIELQVIDHLDKLFTDKYINTLTNNIYSMCVDKLKSSNSNVEIYEDKLSKIDVQINNIVDAIAGGLMVPSMSEKLKTLEIQKNDILNLVNSEKQRAEESYTFDDIKKYLSQGKGIAKKTKEEQKKSIETYVKKVVVFEDSFDIHLYTSLDVDTLSGGEPLLYVSTSTS